MDERIITSKRSPPISLAILGTVGVLLVGMANPPIQLIHPLRDFLLVNSAGAEIIVQLKIARHKDNRSYQIKWFGEGCGGSQERQLDGHYSAATQYPIKIRVYAGTCDFLVSVFTQGREVRVRKKFKLEVVGIINHVSN